MKIKPINILIEIMIFILKVWGRVWVFVAIPFRGYARNVVYNYILQNNGREWLKRLWERNPKPAPGIVGWVMSQEDNKDHGKLLTRNGYIKWRKVNSLQFWLVFVFIWSWLDDDSVNDTTDIGHINRMRSGSQPFFLFVIPTLIIRPFIKNSKLPDQFGDNFGSSFDLGDNIKPYFNWWQAFLWNDRNTWMNGQYLLFNY